MLQLHVSPVHTAARQPSAQCAVLRRQQPHCKASSTSNRLWAHVALIPLRDHHAVNELGNAAVRILHDQLVPTAKSAGAARRGVLPQAWEPSSALLPSHAQASILCRQHVQRFLVGPSTGISPSEVSVPSCVRRHTCAAAAEQLPIATSYSTRTTATHHQCGCKFLRSESTY
jgi:hypothetical protein